MRERNPRVDWAVRTAIALALLFIGVIPKVTGDPTMVANFARWGYPENFHLVVAAGEVLGIVLLLAPRFVGVGAALVVLLMLGATGTHLRFAEYAFAPIPAALGTLACVVGWPRWRKFLVSRDP